MQKFESDTKTFLLNFFIWEIAIFIIIIVLFFFLVKTIVRKIIAKKNAKIWEEQNQLWQEQRRKGLREEKRRIKKERELIRLEQTESPENQYKTTPKMYRENKIKEGQKAYLENELDEAELKFLTTSGFEEVEQTDLDGKKNLYLVFHDKFESPRHIICVKEIVDYLKQFTKDIQTYRTVMPDIVFIANEKEYAIEVETGKIIKDKKKMQNKISLLKERYGKNWFFFVTNRNLEKEYSKLGETSTKRNVKSKIDKIFRNSIK
jgi:F0F1-type ATP synthase membrane subunit b/b'